MSVLCFSIFSTLLILGGSRIFVNAQNCALPNSITFLETDNDARVENATVGTVLGTVQTFNVWDIQPLETSQDDFIEFSLQHLDKSLSEIELTLKRPLKNELDDKGREGIGTTALLTCADGNQKKVIFNVGMKDQNTKCPQFGASEYYYEINLDEFFGPGISTNLTDRFVLSPPITIKDEDRDFRNADVNVTVETEFKNFHIHTNIQSKIFPEFEKEDEHNFEITLSLKIDQIYRRDIQKMVLRVSNNEPISDPYLNCSEDSRSKAKVFINFISTNDSVVPIIPDDPHVEGPPVFSSFYYYAVVKDMSKAVMGSSLDNILQPSPINASDPDKLHTVVYRILENRDVDVRILDIDPYNGRVSFKADLTEDYVNGLKDHMEIYRIEAYIGETWQKPTMKFSTAPLIVVYDVNRSDNSTDECTTPAPTDYPPIVTSTQEWSITTKEPNSTTTTEPSSTTGPITTTTATTEPSHSTTTAITEPPNSTTTAITEPPNSTTTATTEPPNSTTTATTEPNSTTSATTTGPSSTTTATAGPSSTTGPNTTTTTTATPITTTLTTGSTSSSTNTTTTTEEYSEVTTTESNDITTEPGIPITTNPTSQHTTSNGTTTQIPTSSTTTKPDCPICSAKGAEFSCKNEGLFKDPNLCNVFHQCVKVNDSQHLEHFPQRCPPYTGFDPNSKTCQYPPRCNCSQTEVAHEFQSTTYSDKDSQKLKAAGEINHFGYGDGDISPEPNCPGCTCGVCSQVLPGESVCDGASTLYPDPHSCNVFHSCRSDDQGGYIDCLMPCPGDLHFCPIRKVCTWPYEVDCQR